MERVTITHNINGTTTTTVYTRGKYTAREMISKDEGMVLYRRHWVWKGGEGDMTT